MLYFSHNRKTGAGRSQRGASLIEVLVALILLVVGIYSIARLFPGGFFSLRSAQDSDVADRLAQAQLEQLKQDNNFLLDAVYMYSNEVGFFADNSNVLPNAAGTYTPPGGTVADATLADINKARYISGETFTVPAPNTVASATNGVSVHVLNDGPIVPSFAQVTSTTAPASVRGLPPGPQRPLVGQVRRGPAGEL